MKHRSLPVLAVLGLVIAACGSKEPDRFTLKTPGANTGEAVAVPQATATPTPTPTPSKPKVPGGAVTRSEKRIVRGWSEALRHGRVAAASKYFSVPSIAANNDPGGVLASRQDVEQFNRTLPCGAKLLKTARGNKAHWVVGTFVLTRRPGASCGTGTGQKAFVAFQIKQRHITEWLRIDQTTAEATPTPEPTPSPTPSPPKPVTDDVTD